MRVVLLGTGSALPSAERVQSGVCVERDDRRILVDCGSGVVHRLAQAGIDHRAIETVVLTHHHLDHVCDLPTLLKARVLEDRPNLSIHGPIGTRRVCDHLFAVDDLADRAALTISEHTAEETPIRIDGFRVEAVETTHSKQCFAYRIDDTLVLGGDTAPNANVFGLAEGVHTLVHECSFPDGVEASGHTTPSELGAGLGGIDLDRVVLTHLFPRAEPVVEEMVETVQRDTDARVSVGVDLCEFEVPT